MQECAFSAVLQLHPDFNQFRVPFHENAGTDRPHPAPRQGGQGEEGLRGPSRAKRDLERQREAKYRKPEPSVKRS
jgi:hypothetical protein